MNIPLASRKYPGLVAVIDDADAELVAPYTWCPLHQRGKFYAVAKRPRGSPTQQWRMHVLIMGRRGIDHKNGNGLDNRRVNLRDADQSHNLANTGPRRGSSPFKGVHRDGVRWRAVITVNRRSRHIGRYREAEEAARAYDRVAREVWGDHARVNFP